MAGPPVSTSESSQLPNAQMTPQAGSRCRSGRFPPRDHARGVTAAPDQTPAAMTRRRGSARPSENQLTTRNSCQPPDNWFTLAGLHAGFKGLDGVFGKDVDTLVTHNSQCRTRHPRDAPTHRTATHRPPPPLRTLDPRTYLPAEFGRSVGWVFRVRAWNAVHVRRLDASYTGKEDYVRDGTPATAFRNACHTVVCRVKEIWLGVGDGIRNWLNGGRTRWPQSLRSRRAMFPHHGCIAIAMSEECIQVSDIGSCDGEIKRWNAFATLDI
jgi:hypothetical protein